MKKLVCNLITVLSLAFFGSSFAQTTELVTPINLNTATDEEILSVPNVGNRMLREFKEYRPYVNIEQFQRELGKYVDEAQVAEWENYVFVPTNPNTATEDEILALPNIDEAMTKLIVENREYADWAALSSVLSKSYDEVTVKALESLWIFE